MKKTQIGIVVSDKMQNTAIVEVAYWKVHRIIKKRYRQHQRFVAHNPENIYRIGDRVEITETRPQSKKKRWAITQKLGVV